MHLGPVGRSALRFECAFLFLSVDLCMRMWASEPGARRRSGPRVVSSRPSTHDPYTLPLRQTHKHNHLSYSLAGTRFWHHHCLPVPIRAVTKPRPCGAPSQCSRGRACWRAAAAAFERLPAPPPRSVPLRPAAPRLLAPASAQRRYLLLPAPQSAAGSATWPASARRCPSRRS